MGVQPEIPERDYRPIHPEPAWRSLLRKIWAPIAVVAGLVLKFGFAFAKFASVFVAVGGYALLWGWKFGVGVVVLIFIHELGHFVEARRRGFNAAWPVFIPFLGAYVKHTRGNPWQTARVAIAGPILGGVAALGCYLLGQAQGSNLLVALAYFGFFLNLINLLPFSILDGASVWRSTRFLWYGGGRDKAIVSGTLYLTTAFLLAVGMYAAYLPQHRL